MGRMHTLDLTNYSPKEIRPFALVDAANAVAPDGTTLDFTNYYMTVNGKPFLAVCGECHYSRLDASRWDVELAKMAAGGVNVVSTYVFWNHHEEREGEWNFSGNRDLRRFVQLAAKHGLYVIVRMGPFDHGEVRNGGLPDWLYGKPYEVRSIDPAFLDKVRDLYEHEAAQLEGLYFKDGGPIIAAQLDNEYMHSSAPWELTGGTSNEWIPAGHDGMAYLDALRGIALEAGIAVPFYTSTGWGGSPVPDDVLPLWGGYAYRPWLFYKPREEGHPLTDEYVYRNFHDAACPRNEEFDPSYDPESKPYACCEMGGGMFNSYDYRFELPMKSVDAMANIKLGSGCNVLGYYMFHGGTNPLGAGQYLNEGQVAKRSYDFQAALGEFGQVRESYRRLRTLHRFARDFGERLAPMGVVVPCGQGRIDPADLDALRWCVRTDGHSGFVFLNNFQDHASMGSKRDEDIELVLADGDVVSFEHVGLDEGENCVLPFNLDLDGVPLASATVQPVAVLRQSGAGARTFVFMRPDGMGRPVLKFGVGCGFSARDESVRVVDGTTCELDAASRYCCFEVTHGRNVARIVVVDRALSNDMLVLGDEALAFVGEGDCAFWSDGAVAVESSHAEPSVRVVPAEYLRQGPLSSDGGAKPDRTEDLLPQPLVSQVGPMRFVIELPERALQAVATGAVTDLLLRVSYCGDIGWLWCDATLVSDNFANGAVWEVSVRDNIDAIRANGNRLVLVITPLRQGATVNVESSMAARSESVDGLVGGLDGVDLRPVFVRRFATAHAEVGIDRV